MAVEVRAFLQCRKHPSYQGKRLPRGTGCSQCLDIYSVTGWLERNCRSYRLRFFTKKVAHKHGSVR